MAESIKRLVTGALTLLCAALVYAEIGSDSTKPFNNSTAPAYETVANLDGAKMFRELGGVDGEVPVVMFVTSWCGVCRALESSLREQHIPFVKVDIEKNDVARFYYKVVTEYAPSGVVPLTMVDTKRFVGFLPEEISQAIAEWKSKSGAGSGPKLEAA